MAHRTSRTLSATLKPLISQWWLPVTLVALWWLVSAGSTNFFFPPLSKIVSVTLRDFGSGLLFTHLAFSLANMAAGLLIATLIGVAFGLIIGESTTLRQATAPTLNFLRSVPPAAIVPLVIIAMGIGAAPKIFLIALGCIWPILLNTVDGVRGVNPQLLETARAFRIPYVLRTRKMLFMAALPQIMAGIRISIAVALVLMVIAEFFGASQGIGFYIREKKEAFAMAETWGGTIVIGILGFMLSAAFLTVERRLLAWHHQDTPETGGDG